MSVTVAAELFTLIGVGVGAGSTYLVNSLGERSRFKREVSRGWEQRRFDCLATYINSVKVMSVIARRMAVALGNPDQTRLGGLAPDEGASQLDEAEVSRSLAMEKLRLLADEDTISAAHALNRTVWVLEAFARGQSGEATPDDWRQAMLMFIEAFDHFHRCARIELGVPGRPVAREELRAQSAPAAVLGSPKTDVEQ